MAVSAPVETLFVNSLCWRKPLVCHCSDFLRQSKTVGFMCSILSTHLQDRVIDSGISLPAINYVLSSLELRQHLCKLAKLKIARVILLRDCLLVDFMCSVLLRFLSDSAVNIFWAHFVSSLSSRNRSRWIAESFLCRLWFGTVDVACLILSIRSIL